jgi:uncharacterized protein
MAGKSARCVLFLIVLRLCDASRQIAEQKEGHPIGLIAGARLVPFGIGRLVELQKAGWSYVHD